MLRDCPYSTKTREVLGNLSPPPSRFPSGFALGKSFGRRGWISQYLPRLGGARIHSFSGQVISAFLKISLSTFLSIFAFGSHIFSNNMPYLLLGVISFLLQPLLCVLLLTWSASSGRPSSHLWLTLAAARPLNYSSTAPPL